MFSEQSLEGTIRYDDDSFQGDSHHRVDNRLFSNSGDTWLVDDIDVLVDRVLATKRFSSVEVKSKNTCSASRMWRPWSTRKAFGIVHKVPVKKIVSVLLSLLLVFVTIASASLIQFPEGANGDDLMISLDPDEVRDGDPVFVNVTVPVSFNIGVVTVDFAGIESIDLLLSDNSSLKELWQGVWMIHDVEVGEHVITITAFGEENTSHHADVKWNVLPRDDEDNETRGNILDGTFDVENNYSNTNTTVIDEENSTLNQTHVSIGLNVLLHNDEESYIVNETVLIYGNVSYNNSLVNTSIDLLIFSSSYNSSIVVNATEGEFYYRITSTDIGIYTVQAIVIYENQTAGNEITFRVLGRPSDNISLIPTNLYIWDNTVYNKKYTGDIITFYTNYSCSNQSIENATCLISFNNGSWTEPKRMNHSDGYYVYRGSFNVSGTYEFQVECIAYGYQNRSSITQFFIYGNESTVSIVDPKEEHIDVVPGTRFYVERTVDGLHGTDVIFAPLFSDALMFEKIEVLYDSGDDEKRVVKTSEYDVSLNYRVYRAGRPLSHIEKNIDMQRKKLPSELRELDQVAYSQPFTLQSPCTVRIWFKAPSWEEIDCGSKPSSGRISYLVFSDDMGDGFDFEGSTWWGSDWGYRKLITINSSQVDATLTNFPILVYSTSDSDLAFHAQDDGDDIAFVLYSDNSTQLNHEVELFNGTTGELVAWVNVTSLSSSVDTKIWMYYGNSTCSSQENIADTWDGGFEGVQHFNESSGTLCDSTSNDMDVTAGGTPTYAANAKVGNGIKYTSEAASNMIYTTSPFDTVGNNWTLEFWANYSQIVDYQTIIWLQADASGNWKELFSVSSASDILVWWGNGPSGGDTLINMVWGSWHHWAFRYNDSTQKTFIYKDGVIQNPSGYSADLGNSVGSAKWAHFNRWDAPNQGGIGTLDEWRFSTELRSPAWINTCYNTMNNTATFLNFSSEQQNTGPTITGEIPSNGSIDISPTPTLNVTVDDADDDTLTAYWCSNSSGSWVLFATNSSVDTSSGSVNIIQTNSNFSNYSVRYYWSVNLTDGTNWRNETYHFNTAAINTSVATISPYEVTTSILSLTSTGDGGLDNVTLWYRYSSDNSMWWNSSWKYRKKLTINSSQVSGDLTNFPILVNITDSNLSSKAQSDGDDIVFTNSSGIKLNHELELFNGTTGELVAWVNVTSLSGSTDTEIYMYYGNSTCSSQENVYDTWNSGYVGVWHLSETPTVDSYAYDSTSNDNNGTFEVSMNSTDQVDGQMDGSLDFDGGDDYVQINDGSFFSIDNFTLSLWAYRATDSGTYEMLLDNRDANDNGWRFLIWDDDKLAVSYNTIDVKSTTNISTTQWYYLVATADGTTIKIYINGTQNNSGLQSGSISESTNLIIGARSYTSQILNWPGRIDDIRISNIARNSSWIGATYNSTNNPSTFIGIGSEENWMQWSDASNPDTSSPWSWEFDFPNSTGYYDFYSIGKKTGNTDETAPNSADTICFYRGNTAPEISNPYPINESTDISVNPMLNITINDAHGDTMTITWYSNSSGSWLVFGTNSSISNGTYHQTNTNFSNYSITYYWNISVNDGTDTNNSAIYRFTTEIINTSIDSITPYEITASTLSITATSEHNDYSNVTLWYRYSSNNSTWWNSSWSYAKKIIINSSQVSETLTNFPILFHNTSSDFAAHAQSDGDDFTFIDATNTTQYNHEIESYNSSTGDLIAWVNVTTVNSTTDTILYLYYGNPICNNQETSAGTWDSNHVGVWHFNEIPGVDGYVYDSTSNNNDGSFITMDSSNQVPGKIGGSLTFDGSAERVETGVIAHGIGTGNFTYEGWVWRISDTGNAYQGVQSNGDYAPCMYVEVNSENVWGGYWGNPMQTSQAFPIGSWHHIVMVRRSGTIYLYYDSVEDSNNYSRSNSMPNALMRFGASSAIATNHANVNITDARFSNIARNMSWIGATYNSTNNQNTFLSIESEEGWLQWSDGSNPDASSPWSWEFNFPNSTGYYDFYSIGKKSGSIDEAAPNFVDAICHFNPDLTIEITPSYWHQGAIDLGDSNATTGFYFNLTNNGTIILNIQIKASNATNATTGAEWQLTAIPGHDTFSLQYNLSGGGTWANINTTYDTFVTNLGIDSWQTFDLNLIMATTATDQDPLALAITFKSVIA
ncbi:MAG: DUF2341 domain-containing protein [Candidatus Thermoplasmatota archaeon]|nr:DUF2341 domain-containing protein [Candidatus Thermoplasmatota archaeon]MBU1940882.1 DUF2341 domain-containing protein [Candidatus Thermoplasmatota archaeon]